MYRQTVSLIWLRSKLLLSNPQYMVLILLPYLFIFIYNYLLGSSLSDEYIVFMTLPILFTIGSGQILSSIISEEKEKNNLKELQLSGVKELAYICSSVLFPLLFSILGIVLFPIILTDIEFSSSYFIINILTAITVILMFLIVGTISQSVTQAQIYTFPLLLLTMFLPILSVVNDTISKLAKYTYMSAYIELFDEVNNSIYTSSSFFILIVWIILLFIISVICYKKFIIKID